MGKSEYVLCTDRWDAIAGVLMVTPDFTSVTSSSTERVSRLDPYCIEVDGDARNTYHCWIEHASVDMSQEERDKNVLSSVRYLRCIWICSVLLHITVHEHMSIRSF